MVQDLDCSALWEGKKGTNIFWESPRQWALLQALSDDFPHLQNVISNSTYVVGLVWGVKLIRWANHSAQSKLKVNTDHDSHKPLGSHRSDKVRAGRAPVSGIWALGHRHLVEVDKSISWKTGRDHFPKWEGVLSSAANTRCLSVNHTTTRDCCLCIGSPPPNWKHPSGSGLALTWMKHTNTYSFEQSRIILGGLHYKLLIKNIFKLSMLLA